MSHSRRKGVAGERAVSALIREALPGVEVARNLVQAREGGSDLLAGGPLERFALEVKRVAVAKPADWRRFWAQAQAQAEKCGKYPLLVVREDRRDCVVQCFAHHLWPGAGDAVVFMPLVDFLEEIKRAEIPKKENPGE